MTNKSRNPFFTKEVFEGFDMGWMEEIDKMRSKKFGDDLAEISSGLGAGTQSVDEKSQSLKINDNYIEEEKSQGSGGEDFEVIQKESITGDRKMMAESVKSLLASQLISIEQKGKVMAALHARPVRETVAEIL